MSNPFNILATPKSMSQRRLQLRQQLWPEVMAEEIWDRKTAKGFTSVPRTLPIFQVMLDRCSVSKPLGSTYLDIWCRANDEGFVECSRPQEMAFSSGFTTKRGIHIWAERVTILNSLGFIILAEGAHGPRSFALLRNPYLAALGLRSQERVDNAVWNALVSQSSQIGAIDLTQLSTIPPLAPTPEAPLSP